MQLRDFRGCLLMRIVMKKANLIVSALFFVFSIFALYASLQLPPSKNGVPGPGAWPLIISVVMLLSSLALAIKTLFSKDKSTLVLRGADNRRVYLTMLLLIAYLAGMYYIGFVVMTFIMLFGFFTWFGSYKWYTRIMISLPLTIIVYSVFRFILKVPFRFGLLI